MSTFLRHDEFLLEKVWNKNVKSSHLKELKYDNNTKILEVEFLNGSSYKYKEVPEKVFKELAEEQNILNKLGRGIMKSAKKLFGKDTNEGTFGTRFWELIRRGNYEYEKIK
jgi:hypothetical protein